MSHQQRSERTVADYVIEVLISYGVKHVFGYPGASIIPFLDSISKHPSIDFVLSRHEGSSSLSASANAKLTGRLAVCTATSGPGLSNLVTGILDAHLDRVPLLAITGLLPSSKQGRLEFQDLNQSRLIGSIVSSTNQCSSPESLPALLRDCIGRAINDRDVVHIGIDSKVQSTKIDNSELWSIPHPANLFRSLPPRINDSILNKFVEDLSKYHRIVVVVGNRAQGAGIFIETIAQKLQSPIITSIDAKGIVNDENELCMGVLGIFGSPGSSISQNIIKNADAILAFGSDDPSTFLTDHDGVQIRPLFLCDLDFTSPSHFFYCSGVLFGDISHTADLLAKHLKAKSDGEFLELAKKTKVEFFETHKVKTDPKFTSPVNFLQALSRRLNKCSRQTVIAFDVGDNTVWSALFLNLTKYQRVIQSTHLGTMGFCLPACVAAKVEDRNSVVIGITGDGGFQMCLGELGTAVQYQLGVIVIVFSNSVLGRMISQQEIPFGTTILNPDFVAYAKSWGADGACVNNDEQIEQVLDQVFDYENKLIERSVPFVIEVKIDPKSKAPFTAAGGH